MTLSIRACGAGDIARILEIVNGAAFAYRGAIPADCWHEPYMTRDALEREMADGVSFLGAEDDGALIGVMGIQHVLDVDLIRHAYVAPEAQRRGVGGLLMERLLSGRAGQVLVGTWADATWAIAFYERHGFALVGDPQRQQLLDKYWTIPARQRDVSVVLARHSIDQ